MARAVGIDVGSDGVRVVELERKGTTMRVRRYLHLSRAELRTKGIEEATEAPESVARILVADCAARGISLRNPVALGITGRDSIVRYMNVPPMPPWRLKLIMAYEIQESSARANEKLQADFRLVPVPRETISELTCLIAMVKDEPVQARLDAMQRGGINVSPCSRTRSRSPTPGTTSAHRRTAPARRRSSSTWAPATPRSG